MPHIIIVFRARAQQRGRELWYASYRAQVAEILRDYGYSR